MTPSLISKLNLGIFRFSVFYALLLTGVFLYSILKYREYFKRFEKVGLMFPGPHTIPVLGNALQLFGNSNLFFILLLTGAILYAILKYRMYFKHFEKVNQMFPGPQTLPFLGNALMFFGDSHYLYNQGMRFCLLYRRSFTLWIGPRLLICLQRPQEVEAVLNNTEHITKSSIYNYLIPWIKRGLLTSYGKKWNKNRKVLTPAFHFKILDGFIETFHKNAEVMCEILESQIECPSFNIQYFVKLCTLDNIAETAMGVTLNAQRDPALEYAKAIKTMCYLAFLRTARPWYAFDFIFNLSGYGRQQKEALTILHNYSRNVINQRLKQRKETKIADEVESENVDLGIKSKKAFLDLLLDFTDSGSLTLDEVQEEVDTFMFEGHDTITAALSFAFHNLAHNSNSQDRICQELEEIFGSDDRMPTMEDLNQMKYLEMVIKETLRLYPSVPTFGRYIEKDLKIDEYTTIPAGAEAILITAAIHRSPDYWENPDTFDPDRFSPENSVKRHPYSFIPFSAGPRNCIGLKFAMLEMKSTISRVVRKFVLKPSIPDEPLILGNEVVLVSHNGVPISLELRK